MNIPFFNIGKTPEKRRNKIIVFANQKGGCGKTTNCVLSAGQFVLKHHCRLVVLDGDPQRSIVKNTSRIVSAGHSSRLCIRSYLVPSSAARKKHSTL